jgi:predicted  nucleic acid-binding Zn-ribbon protein
MLDSKDPVNKGDRNKIYFLIVVIAALLGTNAFLFFKDKHEKERFVTTNTEKDRLKLEVEKIEVEFEKVNSMNVALTDKMQREQQLARAKIAELKKALQKSQLTQGQLIAAQNELTELKTFISNYKDDLSRLEKENSFLKSERDSLVKSVSSVNAKAEELEKKNSELDAKVKSSAALKAFNVQLSAYKVKSSGKNIDVSKASAAKKLIVHFNIVPNQLAEKDYHKIYLRVFDPTGNLIANENNMFEADGQEMQYSDMITISYNNDDTAYTIDFVNPKPFIKGTYSIILYANGFTMGKAAVVLK